MTTAENVNAETPTLRLTLPARAENIAVVRQALAGLAAELGAGPELIDDIKTAVSEAATNVVTHAYPDDEQGPIEISADISGRNLEVLIRDAGVGMQPHPLDPDRPTLRVGLALIGALADSFEVSGEEGVGTEVRLSFDLYRDADGATNSAVVALHTDTDSPTTQIVVRASEPGGAAIPKVLEMLVARAGLTLDQLSDAQLLGDFLSDWSASATIDSQPLELSIEDGDGCVELCIGPLDPGLGRQMLERSEVSGLGRTLDRLADRVEVDEVKTDGGPAEYLVLEIRAPA
ncbi:MAG: ATP-binding protein [Solirubrobacterales bacterium]